jgi:hypothetical protein
MHTVTRVFLITGFVLTIGLQPSWGGAPPNNVTSDTTLFNTAGDTNALVNNTTDSFNPREGRVSC